MPQPTTERDAIYSTFADDPDFAELVDLFVSEMPQRIELLETSTAPEHREQLRRAAHQLKGAAGSYGFQGLTDSAARLEDAVRGNEAEKEIQDSLLELLALCRRVRPGVGPG